MYLTSERRNDGFGAQFQTILYTALFAEHLSLPYIYRPIKEIGNYDDETFYEEIDRFVNLKKKYNNLYEFNSEQEIKCINYQLVMQTVESNFDTLLESETIKTFKELFWEHKNRISLNSDDFTIAIHIRRYNEYDHILKIYRNYRDFNYYKDLMHRLRNIYKDKKCIFHIYSQGKMEEFKLFAEKDVVLHIDEGLTQKDFFDHFVGLVGANVLVTSNSSFSYTAALLTDGIVYYEKCVHPPARKWIQLEELMKMNLNTCVKE
jgi:hypothetical protein